MPDTTDLVGGCPHRRGRRHAENALCRSARLASPVHHHNLHANVWVVFRIIYFTSFLENKCFYKMFDILLGNTKRSTTFYKKILILHI